MTTKTVSPYRCPQCDASADISWSTASGHDAYSCPNLHEWMVLATADYEGKAAHAIGDSEQPSRC